MQTNSSRLNVLSARLLALAMVVSGLAAVAAVTITAAPAFACDNLACVDTGNTGTNPPSGGNTGTNPPSGGNTGGNNGGTTGGSGGVSSYPYSDSGQGWFPNQPPKQIGGTGDASQAGTYAMTSNTYYYKGKCNGNFSWTAAHGTFSAPWLGWKWWVAGDYVDRSSSGAGGSTIQTKLINVTTGGYDCIEPPRYDDVPVMCALYADGWMDGPMKNPTVASAHKVFQRRYSAWYNNRSNPALCNTSYKYQFGDNPTQWGQYELHAVATQVNCTRRDYFTKNLKTGVIPPSKIINCGSPYTVNPNMVRLELFCKSPYFQVGWSNNWSFTSADCEGPGGGEWTCGPANPPTFAGALANNPVAVLDDGLPRRGMWAQASPSGTGVKNVRDRKARLVFRSGSPYRLGFAVDQNQPFGTDPGLNKWVDGWTVKAPATSKKSGWDMAFMAPGLPGAPWKASPEWMFTADFKIMVPTITWDLQTNTVTVTLSPKWTPVTGNVCTGKPVQLNVNRARNSTH